MQISFTCLVFFTLVIASVYKYNSVQNFRCLLRHQQDRGTLLETEAPGFEEEAVKIARGATTLLVICKSIDLQLLFLMCFLFVLFFFRCMFITTTTVLRPGIMRVSRVGAL